jgi:hypothetical protein
MYEWTGDVAGKVWASGASYDVKHDATSCLLVLLQQLQQMMIHTQHLFMTSVQLLNR